MRPFNLAESRILERNYCQAHVNRRLRNVAIMLGLTALVAIGSLVCRSMFAGEVRQTQSRLADAQGRCARAKREMSAVNVSMSEYKWQGQLASESKRWLGVLEMALKSVPPDVWLNSVTSSAAESSLAIDGRAASIDSVTTFINALRSNATFGEVRLESAKMSNGAQTCVDFTLAVKLKGGGSGSTTSAGAAPAATTSGSQPSSQQPATPTNRVPEVQGST